MVICGVRRSSFSDFDQYIFHWDETAYKSNYALSHRFHSFGTETIAENMKIRRNEEVPLHKAIEQDWRI